MVLAGVMAGLAGCGQVGAPLGPGGSGGGRAASVSFTSEESDGQPPIITITSPVEGAVLDDRIPMTIQGSAQDADGAGTEEGPPSGVDARTLRMVLSTYARTWDGGRWVPLERTGGEPIPFAPDRMETDRFGKLSFAEWVGPLSLTGSGGPGLIISAALKASVRDRAGNLGETAVGFSYR